MLKEPRFRTSDTVSDAIGVRVRHLFLRHYFIPANEIEDLINAAVVDYLRAKHSGQDNEQLFLVIARRRACDFCRRRRRERAIPPPEAQRVEMEQSRLENHLLERIALRFVEQHPRLDRRRFVRVVHAILNDATVAQACRKNGIPRGSHPRYRALLQQCFGVLRPQRSNARN